MPILILVAVGLLVGVYAMYVQLAVARQKIRVLDANIELLLRHTGLQPTALDLLPDTVQHAIRQGDRIGAIKLYRAHSGAGLHEAATLIDAACNTLTNTVNHADDDGAHKG